MKNLLTACLLTVVFLLAQAPISSQEEWVPPHYYDGADLLRLCQTDLGTIGGGVGAGVCLGYISGAVDVYQGVEVRPGKKPDGTYVLPLCIPNSGFPNNVVRDIVTSFLKDHPERLKQPAYYLTRQALESFGCKTGAPVGILP